MCGQAPFGAFRPLAHRGRTAIRAVIIVLVIVALLGVLGLIVLGVVLVSPTARPSPLGSVNAVLDVILFGVFFGFVVGHNSITITQGAEK